MVFLTLFTAGLIAWGVYILFFPRDEEWTPEEEYESPPGTPVSSSDEDEADYPNGRPVTIEDYTQNPQFEDESYDSDDTDTTDEFDVSQEYGSEEGEVAPPGYEESQESDSQPPVVSQ